MTPPSDTAHTTGARRSGAQTRKQAATWLTSEQIETSRDLSHRHLPELSPGTQRDDRHRFETTLFEAFDAGAYDAHLGRDRYASLE